MKSNPIFITAFSLCIAISAFGRDNREAASTGEYTVIANPGEDAAHSARINWHSDLGANMSKIYYTTADDSTWTNSRRAQGWQEVCTAYNGHSSKNPAGQDIFEDARFIRNTVELRDLNPDTEYIYRFSTDKNSTMRRFRTAPLSGNWSAAIISDFHAYTPLPKRVDAAMSMLDTLEARNGGDFNLILHVGDICAWGGSYSFWRDLYTRPQFAKYTWAGVNGNHDNMDRKSKRLSNDYFHFANNNPNNGYGNERGVCYYFKWNNTLFIMLNSEAMRSDDGLAEAQKWVKDVIKDNPAKYVVVMEHYQWFFATNGRTSQYERWCKVFDECGVDLAIGGNNHIYARTNAIYDGRETDGSKGTVYLQTASSDNERGQALQEWTDNKDMIKFRWSEGPKTVGGILLKADDAKLRLTMYDREGRELDSVEVLAKH